MHPFLPILLQLSIFTIPILSSPIPPPLLHQNATDPPPPPQYNFEVTQPLPTTSLTPSCTLALISHNFSYTYDQPPVTIPYSPPENCTWSNATIEFSVSSKGTQHARIASIWLAGAELLRTSTAKPTENGVFWKTTKDITKYNSLLIQENITVSVMLENKVDSVFTGVYVVNVTFIYYDSNDINEPLQPLKRMSRRFLENNDIALNTLTNDELTSFSSSSGDLYAKPADLIIPISGFEEEGYWFRLESESDKRSERVAIPKNTYKAVLEMYVSFHGNDEFWYKNPANSLNAKYGNGAYREVIVTIDGNFVGSAVPFPVIYTGGINPLFWDPVVGIGAFDLPTYDIDFTPFLSFLIDGDFHRIGISVEGAISYWLVDANLHLWLDPFSEEVQAGYFENKAPSFEFEKSAESKGLDAEFEVEMERKREFSGWVNSSFGNFTTYVKHELEFENEIEITKNGNEEKIEQKVKEQIEVKVLSDTGNTISESKLEKEFPLKIKTSSVAIAESGGYNVSSSLDNSYEEKIKNSNGSSTLKNRQQASGWMVVVDGAYEVVDGEASTNQSYSYKGNSVCYSRVIGASNGTILSDSTNFLCMSSH
ncbi:hypothetical protein Leryth_007422 [Lithospermum erythrorhizon]|nr:hypothetical protein Leryth_007422 [Lithospermum erythrorhizon]